MSQIDYTSFVKDVEELLPRQRVRLDESMRLHTTWRVGGSADVFIETLTTDELIGVLHKVNKHALPVFILGGGSNILVGDKGVRGVVIKHLAREYDILGDPHGSPQQVNLYRKLVSEWEDHSGEARYKAVHFGYYDDRNPNRNAESVFVRLTSGYVMSSFIEEMFKQGVTGLEHFARIPGTFGGWVYNNVHGNTQFIGDFVHSVVYMDESLIFHEGGWKDMEFMYNQSRFHCGNDIIISGVLRLFRGDVGQARTIYTDVLKRKLEHQPGNSAGCVFHNITSDQAEQNNFESVGPGYVIDKVLGWNGKKRVGGAWISAKHGNFIETDGTASAQDVVALIDMIKSEFRARFNIELKEEFFRVGEF